MRRLARDAARRFLADRSGAIAAMAALLSTVLIGFGGLAAETAFWHAQQRALQTQADAAALSGAYELLQGNSANAASWATKDAVLNGFSNAAPNTITSSCSGTSCTVTLSIQHNTALASAFLPTVTIRAQAKAELKSFDPGNVACIIATGLGTVLDFLAQNATSLMPNCTLVVTKSANAGSVTIANGSVTADTIWSHGGYSVTGTTAPTLTRPAMTYAASSSTYMPVDPYASSIPTLPAAIPNPVSPCSGVLTAWNPASNTGGSYTALSFDNGNNKQYDCGGVNTVTLTPGVYFITGVDGSQAKGKGGGKANYAIDLPNNTTLSCPTCTCSSTQGGTGVTFIMIPDASGIAGGVSIAGNSSVTLCPPNAATTGSGASIPKGLLFYQCDSSNTYSRCSTVQTANLGNSGISTGNGPGVTLTGVAYFPSSKVAFAQPSGSLTLKCFITIASLVTISSLTNSSNASNCSAAGISTDFPGTGIVAQKTYQVVMTQ